MKNAKEHRIGFGNKHQRGQVLVITIIMVLIGSIIITPLLNYMMTGLKTGQTFKTKEFELYSADSGVQDALWQLMQSPVDPGIVPSIIGQSGSPYSLPAAINGCNVNVTLQRTAAKIYRIVSTASSGSSATTVTADITNEAIDLSGAMQQVLTSINGYTEQGGQASITPSTGSHSPNGSYSGAWPTSQQMIDYYLRQVNPYSPYPSANLDLTANSSLGPTYVNGPFTITSSTNGVTLTLNGTLYITGDTLIGQTSQNFTINMNNQTIFVASSSTGSTPALQIGGKCSITGSGAIIAVGDVQFMPNGTSGSNDYLFIMSVNGQSYVKPNGTFYGTVAGYSVWDQNAQISWSNPSLAGGDLNIPGPGPGLWVPVKWDIH